MKREFTVEQLAQADKLVNKKHKIYYPWYRKFIYRVVRKDHEGYYIKYNNGRVECVPMLGELSGNVMSFIALRKGKGHERLTGI